VNNISPFFPSSIVVKSITMTDDNAHPIVNDDIPFYSCDFQCLTNAMNIGVGGIMDFALQVNETYWTYNANLRDFLVQNASAGSNGKIVCIATVPNAYVENALKGGFKVV
jgi:hypothetical protein